MQHPFPFGNINIIGSIYILLSCSCENDIVYSTLMARLYLIPKANINQAGNLKIGPKKKKKSLFIINVSEIKESETSKLFFTRGLVASMESIPMLSLSC